MKSSKKFCPQSDVETDSEEEEQEEDRQQQIESYYHAIFVAQALLHFADDKGNEKVDAAFCLSTRLNKAKLQSMKKMKQATIHDYLRKK